MPSRQAKIPDENRAEPGIPEAALASLEKHRNESIAHVIDRLDLYRSVIEHFPGGICVFDRNHQMVLCNKALRARLGNPEHLFGDGLPSLKDYVLHCAARGEYGDGEAAQLADKRMSELQEKQLIRHDVETGRNGVIEVAITPLQMGGFVETHVDVTRERLRVQQLETVLENFPGGISIMDKDLNLVLCNRQFIELLDYPEELFADGLPNLEDLFTFNARRGEYGDGNIEQLVTDRMELARQFQPHKFERMQSDGTALDICGVPLGDRGFVTTYIDITERLKHQTNAIRMANYCSLTGLPNTSLFEDRLNIALAQAERGLNVALHQFEIHNFNSITEQTGSKSKQKLLKILGERLSYVRRSTDTVAHFGNGRFGAVQIGIADQYGAQTFAQRIQQTIYEPIELEDRIYELEACNGIVLSPEDGTLAEELRAQLETALFNASTEGAGTIRFFHDCITTGFQDSRHQAGDLVRSTQDESRSLECEN